MWNIFIQIKLNSVHGKYLIFDIDRVYKSKQNREVKRLKKLVVKFYANLNRYWDQRFINNSISLNEKHVTIFNHSSIFTVNNSSIYKLYSVYKLKNLSIFLNSI